MAFSDGDKAIIEETAWRVGKQIAADIKEETRIQIQLHAATCPVAKSAEQVRGGWRAITTVAGAAAGIGALALHWLKSRP